MTTATITSATQLGKTTIRGDRLDVSEGNELLLDGVSASSLIDEFGSPLFVVSEAGLRDNFRRFHTAFVKNWPEKVEVLYAMKANPTLAVRSILSEEGAGADCFSVGELEAALGTGTPARLVVLNGSNKSAAALRLAVESGVGVNIDADDEVDRLIALASEMSDRRPIQVKLRLKVLPKSFESFSSDSTGKAGEDLREYLMRKKWGFTVEPAAVIIRRLLAHPALDLTGYHLHVPRVTQDASFLAGWAGQLAEDIAALRDLTSYTPSVMDIGGGWPRERDPESRSLELNATTIEDYAAAVCAALRDGLTAYQVRLPQLWLEPGRYLVGNAVALLGTVGSIKRDCDLVWVNTDISTNLLARIDATGCVHHVIAATGMHRPLDEVATIAGSTCVDSFLAQDRDVPIYQRGDLVAVLDAGMYAESTSNQFNGLPRPATVLLNGGRADLIRRAEKTRDVFARDVIPARLRVTSTAFGGAESKETK